MGKKNNFFYHVNDSHDALTNLLHGYDECVIEFLNTIQLMMEMPRLNFIRELMGYGQGRGQIVVKNVRCE